MNKKWVNYGEHKSVLSFTPYYEDEEIAEVIFEEDGGWCYNSTLLDATSEYLGSDSLEEAQEDIEALIEEHYQGEINYYKELLDKFLEKF